MGERTGDRVGSRRVEELDGRPAAELVRQLTEQVSRLVRQELQLARLEMSEKGKRAGLGAGLLGGGVLFVIYGLAALVAAAILLLATALEAWVAALVVGLGLLVIAGVLALLGRGQFRRATPPLPRQAAASVKADVHEITTRVRR
jgi:uncharacterized membrane protein YqjE